jgi:carbon storage regulator
MLVLARKVNQNIVIDGRITVKIVRLDGDVVKLGIQAPASVPVHRQEEYDEIQKNNQQAAADSRRSVPKLADPT